MDSIHIELQNLDLQIPAECLGDVQRFTITGRGGKGTNRDDVPFVRYVDIWWMGLCIGIQEERRTTPTEWHTFVRAGEIMASDPWRMMQLQLMVAGATQSTDILFHASKMISVANEYAATGLPQVINEMRGSRIPIWAITSFVESRLGFS